jgi:hypothetical protein
MGLPALLATLAAGCTFSLPTPATSDAISCPDKECPPNWSCSSAHVCVPPAASSTSHSTSSGGTATSSSSGASGTGTTGANSSSGSSSGLGSSSSSGSTSGTPSTATASATTLPFGPVNCGAQGAAQSLTLSATNGTASFTYSAALGKGATSPYAITTGASGAVSPGNAATITITPNALPANIPTLPKGFTDTLTLTTTGASNDSTPIVVQLTEGAQGVILSLNLTSIPFGDVPGGTSQSTTFELSNDGNVDAPVTLSVGSAAAFTVTPASTTIKAGMELVGNVTFSPTAAQSYTGSVTVALGSGVLCQPAPSIALTGTGESGGISLSTNAISFGQVPCGTAAAAQTFTMKNSGNSPMTYSAQLQTGTWYTLSCSPAASCSVTGKVASGSLAPGVTVTFTVTPLSIPATSAVTSDLYGDTVDISTDLVSQPSAQVAIAETALGAILTFNPTSENLGNVPISTSSSQTFQLVNAGNAPASVQLASSNPDFALTSDGGALASVAPVTVGASGDDVFGVTFSPGTSTAAQAAVVSMTASGSTVLCAPLPADDGGQLDVEGQGTNGTVAYSPSALAFGLVDCGSQASPQTVTFSNAGNQPYTITAALDAGTAYTFAITPASGVVAASGTATVTVTPLAIPQTSAVPGGYGDWLTVDTTVNDGDGGTVDVVIPLTESAQGAILTGFTPTNGQVAFSNTPAGGSSTYQLYLANEGNVPATLAYSNVAPPTDFSFAPVTVPGGGNSTWNTTFTPQAAQAYNGSATLGVAAGTVLCQPFPNPPASLTLTGTGINTPTFTASPNPVSFGQVACGSAAPAPQIVTLSNSGTAAVTWTAALMDATLFSISPSSGTVNASSTGTITVTPAPLTTSLGKTGQVGTTLTLDNSSPNTPISVGIAETAEGVILKWTPGGFTFSGCSGSGTNESDVLDNTAGNQPVTVMLSDTGDKHGELAISPNPLPVSAGSTATGTFTCTNPNAIFAAPGETITVTTNLPTGAPLCAPAPGPFNITTP